METQSQKLKRAWITRRRNGNDTAWNKGLTAKTDKRVAKNVELSTATIRKQYANGRKNDIQHTPEALRKQTETKRRRGTIITPVKKGGTHNWGGKISKSMGGKRNSQYIDGRSYIPLRQRYPRAFNNRLKEKIKLRDNYTCQRCGITEKEHIKKIGRKLSVNHIDYNKKNCNPNNLNTLCASCNTIVNSNRSYWKKIFQAKLNKIYG